MPWCVVLRWTVIVTQGIQMVQCLTFLSYVRVWQVLGQFQPVQQDEPGQSLASPLSHSQPFSSFILIISTLRLSPSSFSLSTSFSMPCTTTVLHSDVTRHFVSLYAAPLARLLIEQVADPTPTPKCSSSSLPSSSSSSSCPSDRSQLETPSASPEEAGMCVRGVACAVLEELQAPVYSVDMASLHAAHTHVSLVVSICIKCSV